MVVAQVYGWLVALWFRSRPVANYSQAVSPLGSVSSRFGCVDDRHNVGRILLA